MGISKVDLFTENQNSLAKLAKALAHPARIAILQHLLKMNSCINSDLVQELGLAQATISQHLKELKNVGIIKGSIEGTKMCYCIDHSRWKQAQAELNQLFSLIGKEDCGAQESC